MSLDLAFGEFARVTKADYRHLNLGYAWLLRVFTPPCADTSTELRSFSKATRLVPFYAFAFALRLRLTLLQAQRAASLVFPVRTT